MTAFYWADKVFTASLLVKSTVFTVSLRVFSFPFFGPSFESPHAGLKKKKLRYTGGSLLLLEPDEDSVGIEGRGQGQQGLKS